MALGEIKVRVNWPEVDRAQEVAKQLDEAIEKANCLLEQLANLERAELDTRTLARATHDIIARSVEK